MSAIMVVILTEGEFVRTVQFDNREAAIGFCLGFSEGANRYGAGSALAAIWPDERAEMTTAQVVAIERGLTESASDAMSHRIYTIPAREVVAGMAVVNAVQRHCQVTSITAEEDGSGHLRILGPAVDWSLPGDAMLSVSLLGPSPRELLCECDVPFASCWWSGGYSDSYGVEVRCEVHGVVEQREENQDYGPCEAAKADRPECHDVGCPVYRLRLRLWPVGATWVDGMWLVPLPNGGVHISPDLAVSWLIDRGDLAVTLRAAFCEDP